VDTSSDRRVHAPAHALAGRAIRRPPASVQVTARRRVSYWARALAVALALAGTSACDRSKSLDRNGTLQGAPSETGSPPVGTTKSSNLPAPSAASADAETVCSLRDIGPDGRGNRVVDPEVYSFPKLNRQLAKYPELARAVGLEQVRSCDDARLFGERYQRFRAANPDFDKAERPSKADSILR